MSTIAAISTGQAAGGIGIVRISGEDAILVADRIFRSVSGKKLCDRAGYTALYGTVYYEDKPLDEAVALVFRAPKSYTGEDVCEISCHGGLYITRQILRAALSAGAIPAEAGEFTKRAFLNGKMDLTGAEAVMQMISAHGEQAGAAAFSAMEGALSRKTAEISEILLDASASLAAWVDYPDEEIEDLSDESLLAAIRKAHTMVQDLLNGFDGGRAVTEGIPAAIIGRPNTGKSTLMNMLSGTEKSIVTAIPGTTRDIVEETVLCGNVTLRLADTAGLRETQDTVESIGVERAKKKVSAAEFVFAVFDSSLPFTEEDKEIASLCRNKKAIAVINKTDLPKMLDDSIIKESFSHTVYIAAKQERGRAELESAVASVLGAADFDPSAALLANERQYACCETAEKCLREAIEALNFGMTRDAVGVCMDAAIENLMILTGQKATESVVNAVFSRFCVGK